MDLLYRYTLYFAFYAFLGWAVETVFCAVRFHKLENRGFLIGPICPVYAAGALSILLVMQMIPKTGLAVYALLVFCLGLVITSAVEYLTGWLLEVIFKTRWWDYSGEKFNLHGRICLENSLYFGLLCVALVFFIHPAVEHFVGLLPHGVLKWLAAGFIALLLADLAATVAAVLKLNQRLKQISSVLLALKEKLDSLQWYNSFNIRERISRLYESRDTQIQLFQSVEHLAEHLKRVELDNQALQKRILRAFPNLKSLKYPGTLSGIREQLGTFIKSRR